MFCVFFAKKEVMQHKSVSLILTHPTADFLRNRKTLCRLPPPKIARKRAGKTTFGCLASISASKKASNFHSPFSKFYRLCSSDSLSSAANVSLEESFGDTNVSSLPSLNKIWDFDATVSMFKDFSKLDPSLYQSGSSKVVKIAAHEAKAKCLGERSIKLGTQLLNNCVHVKELNTALLSVGQICDKSSSVIFTKK